MLSTASLQTIVWTSRQEEAARFYIEVLGLRAKGHSHGALVLEVGGQELRVSPVAETQPSSHTVLGFSVVNLRDVMLELAERGVAFERFAGWPHDERGMLTTPEGALVAWLRDPDGNLLSIVQYPA